MDARKKVCVANSEWGEFHSGVSWMPEGGLCCHLRVGNSHPDVLVVGPSKKWHEVGMLPSDGLHASVLGRGPYLE